MIEGGSSERREGILQAGSYAACLFGEPHFREERAGTFTLWEFRFRDPEDYNSVEFVRSAKYRIA